MSKFHRPCKLWGKEFNVTPFTRVVLVKTETGNWLTIYDKDDSLEVSSKVIESDQELEELILEAKYTIAEALNAEIDLTQEVLDALPHDVRLELSDGSSLFYMDSPSKGFDKIGWYRRYEDRLGSDIEPIEPSECYGKATNYSALKVLYQFDLNGQKPL